MGVISAGPVCRPVWTTVRPRAHGRDARPQGRAVARALHRGVDADPTRELLHRRGQFAAARVDHGPDVELADEFCPVRVGARRR
jgi:hypothetical protein